MPDASVQCLLQQEQGHRSALEGWHTAPQSRPCCAAARALAHSVVAGAPCHAAVEGCPPKTHSLGSEIQKAGHHRLTFVFGRMRSTWCLKQAGHPYCSEPSALWGRGARSSAAVLTSGTERGVWPSSLSQAHQPPPDLGCSSGLLPGASAHMPPAG